MLGKASDPPLDGVGEPEQDLMPVRLHLGRGGEAHDARVGVANPLGRLRPMSISRCWAASAKASASSDNSLSKSSFALAASGRRSRRSGWIIGPSTRGDAAVSCVP